MKKGFTLIESLVVVAIIGILATLTTYIITSAQRASRDVTRKNDLAAIAQGFEARAADKTCNNQSDVGFYPGRGTNAVDSWIPVSTLTSSNAPADCGAFTSYLSRVPTDPDPNNYSYLFNLSTLNVGIGQHYRLAASLENPNNGTTDCQNQSLTWTTTYGGVAYDCTQRLHLLLPSTGTRRYSYYVGR